MQPIRRFMTTLNALASPQHYLFTPSDLRVLAKDLSDDAFKTMLSRATSQGYLERICRGLYIHPQAMRRDGLLLFHAAARLRAGCLNYISLETALSDSGVISQIPMNWITMMSSGRSNRISCGRFGTIEFVHTQKRAEDLVGKLSYDDRCGLWRAHTALAIQDMKAAKRNLDLIDWSVVDELI